MASIRKNVIVTITTTGVPTPAGFIDEGYHYVIEGAGEMAQTDSKDITVTFPGVITGLHTVTVTKIGTTFSASGQVTVPDDGNIDVPASVTLAVA